MHTVTQLTTLFQHFMMPRTEIDQFDVVGKPILEQKMMGFIGRNLPIEFVMLGFPFKSTNTRDKVLGVLPDMGEQLTIENFKRFNNSISEVYSPGVKINVVSDGLIFNDLLGVEEMVVEEYKERSLDMAKDLPFNILDLKDFYSTNLDTARAKVMGEFGFSEERLASEILINPDTNWLYKGMIRFMEQELATKTFPSSNQQHKAAKKLAKDMMLRNEAYSALVRKEFKDEIRISMHPSVNNGSKFSFDLIPGGHHSAWHCSIVMDDDKNVQTMHRKDAEALGYHLVYKNNQPYYFHN